MEEYTNVLKEYLKDRRNFKKQYLKLWELYIEE